MRDILFQAKLKDTNYWAEGFYCRMRETTYCCEEDYKRHPVPLHHLIAVDEMTDWGLPNKLRLYEIDPETLCQYTGLCDKNGKKIWENDIVQYGEYTAVVRHGKYTAGFYVDFPEETNYRKDLGYWYEKVSVIGNVLEDTKGNQRMEYREFFFKRILDAFGDEPEEETMEEVTEAEHERTDSEPEREVEELATEPQRDSRVEREDPESGEHEPERIEQSDQKVEEPEKTVISPTKKSEKRTEKRVPKIMENVVEIGESVPKIMEDVTEIEKDVPEISENVIEKEAKVTHQIKLVAEFFDDAAAGRKSFELRKNDRNYKEGDVLEMEEVKDGKKTGRKCSKRIVYMMENFEGLEDGYCILGCELL